MSNELPEGYILAPLNPNRDMIHAGVDRVRDINWNPNIDDEYRVMVCYKAMMKVLKNNTQFEQAKGEL